MKRKLFAFDIDGTLLDNEKQPLDSTMEALEELRKAGHLVTIATGRSRFHAKDVIRDLGFTNYVLCNGAAAFLDHQQIYKNLLDRSELDQFVEEANQLAIDTAFISMDVAKRSTSINVEVMDEAMKSFGATLPELDQLFVEDQEVYQALAFYSRQYEGYFDQKYQKLRFIRWHENCVDVVPKNGSKAATILNVANRLGIDREDVVAFGDGLNDREMLRESGLGIAMGNATAEVQAEADFVTASNEQDGIWKALKELHLL
ncbi:MULTISPECIES: Cof-type HAD-IIB family hydrolase [Enterococcus]|uniref:Cof-type HAD-IIB family hydrolase n=1 Tax=Enterococcus TaxID=1350 RepID=UPI0010F6ED1A|nr:MULTISPECIES: Cof-type HAD-IIB family hydrolase [Enterococcus]KAF1300908.1 HAD family hydrolase [Enterococcus sp. JM9B]